MRLPVIGLVALGGAVFPPRDEGAFQLGFFVK
jgi:hypothetical protein